MESNFFRWISQAIRFTSVEHAQNSRTWPISSALAEMVEKITTLNEKDSSTIKSTENSPKQGARV